MRLPFGSLRTAAILAAAVILVGCAPDRWGVFNADWQRQLDDEARRARQQVPIPEGLEPTPTSHVDVTIPEDGPVKLSLEQAVVLALRQNRDLAVQQLEPVIVGAFEQIERGVYDPEIFAELVYGEAEASEQSRATGEQFGVTTQERGVAAGIRQRLPTGTTVELEASEDRSFSNRTPDQHEARLGLTVTQALLQGFGAAANLVQVRQAELDTLASQYELRGFTEALLAEVETAYWNYTLAREAIAIFEQSLELARRQENDTEQRIEVGVLSPTEAAAARAEVAMRNQDLIDARSELQVARLRLMRLIGVTDTVSSSRSVIPLTSPDAAAEPIGDLAPRVELAHRQRPDLNEARLRLEQNRLDTIVTRNGLLPQLDLFITLGKSGFADSFRQATRNIDRDSYDFAAGVSFSHFLGNRAAEARDLAARATRQQAAASVANLRQLITLDVHVAAAEVERARQQITATAATRQLREEALRAEEERFGVGTSTSLLVAQAQRDLLASRIDEIQAVVEYRLALIDLYLAEGTLLQRRGIDLAPPLH